MVPVDEGSNHPRVLVEWARAASSRDPRKVADLFTADGLLDDVTFHIEVPGRERIFEHFAMFFAAVPDYTVKLERGFRAGDWAVAEVVLSGTQVGDFPGVPATGKPFSVRSASVFELRGDKIRRESDYYDLLKVLRDLGAI